MADKAKSLYASSMLVLAPLANAGAGAGTVQLPGSSVAVFVSAGMPTMMAVLSAAMLKKVLLTVAL